MSEKEKPIDARLDVIERRILMQGETPEEWAVEVAQPLPDFWTTTFYVGVQSFRLAECSSASFATGMEAEQHCMFIGQMFVKAVDAILLPLQSELALLRSTISRASDQLFDSRVDDPQHQVDYHADTLPAVFLKLSAGHETALETLQTLVREWVEPQGAR